MIAGIEPVSRGIITSFTDNDRIGLFLTAGELGTNYQDNAEAANVPAMYQQGSWKVEKDLELSEEGTAFAYYPYSDKVLDGVQLYLWRLKRRRTIFMLLPRLSMRRTL